jgi:hypothetical protein
MPNVCNLHHLCSFQREQVLVLQRDQQCRESIGNETIEKYWCFLFVS